MWEFLSSGMDQCVSETWSSGYSLYSYTPGASSITLQPSSGTSVSMSWDGNYGQYDNYNLSSGQYVSNGTYDLDEVIGSGHPDFEVEDLVRTPGVFSITSPSMSGLEASRVNANNFTISWSGSGGDWMYLILTLYDSGGYPEDTYYCVLNDDGSFTASSLFGSVASNRGISIELTRMSGSNAEIPYNNGDSQVMGGYTNIGIVITQ